MKLLRKCVTIVSLSLVMVSHTSSQTVIFGTNNYIEYQIGTLPLVISVSHGGNLEPASIPNRTCNNPVYAVDAYTIETALEIKNKLFALTGCYPHIVISHLKRNKLDPNRNIVDGACGNQEAMTAWQEFHNFIATARNSANQQYNNNTFFVDLHGHGNPIQRIELGYLLYDDELELSDNILNTAQYINYSSIKNLVTTNTNNYTHAQLLRGQYAFGTLLSNRNYPAVPSQNIPFPGTNSNYFSGGYITANHTCYDPGAPINGLQLELNFSNIRDTPANRSTFANAFAEVLIEYMNKHFNMSWNTCSPLLTNNTFSEYSFSLYPNPIMRGHLIHIDLPENSIYEYEIINLQGQLIVKGVLTPERTIDSNELNSGIYLIKVFNKSNTAFKPMKVIIH
jgi:hypothetical protein